MTLDENTFILQAFKDLVSDLRRWELNLEIWAEKSMSQAWQNSKYLT